MGWESAMAFMDTSCINLLGGIPVTFSPQDGSGDQALNALVPTPAMLDQYVPGGVTGTGTIYLFVRYVSITPNPQKGDVFTVNGIAYMVQDAPVDTQGGSIMKLRAT